MSDDHLMLGSKQLLQIAEMITAIEGIDPDDANNPGQLFIEGPIAVHSIDENRVIGFITSYDGFWSFEEKLIT
jgi:hypothetical protein